MVWIDAESVVWAVAEAGPAKLTWPRPEGKLSE